MLKKIRKNKKGFTLAELLIVVAIIGVLVAISIPIFTAQLEKAREATDLANLRAAKAEVAAAYMTDESVGSVTLGSQQKDAVTVYYDAANGKLTATKPTTGYGKGTATVGSASNSNDGLGYKAETDASGKVIAISVATDGKMTFSWE